MRNKSKVVMQNLELSESLRAAIEKLAANSNKQKLRRNL
jgi:hypothetical protein